MPRVLVADDSETVRKAVRIYLDERPDIEVCAEAKNGREALDQSLELKPDIVILDVVMPEMNGIEVATAVRIQLPNAKVILFTLFGDSVGREAMAAAGADALVEKPNGVGALLRTIDSLLSMPGTNRRKLDSSR
jgi:two-component system, NarL family, response regulator LiaR